MNKRVLPPTYLLLALAAMLALHFLLPLAQIIPAPWTLAGLIPLALGIAVNIAADSLFHRADTSVKPGDEPHVLVTQGPFRYSRNPMYLGFVFILAGIAILLGSLTPLIVIPVFAILIDQQFIQMEEQMLHGAFGTKWQNYASRTRRWL